LMKKLLDSCRPASPAEPKPPVPDLPDPIGTRSFMPPLVEDFDADPDDDSP